MFLIFFLWYTRIFTSFQNCFLGLVFFIFFLGFFFLWWLFSRLFKWEKWVKWSLKALKIQLPAFLLPFFAVLFFIWNVNPSYLPLFFSTSDTDFPAPQEQERVQSVAYFRILDQRKPDTYLLRSEQQSSLLLKTDKQLEVGEIYYIGASYKPLSTRKVFENTLIGSRLLKQTGSWWEELLHYEFNYDKWMMMKGLQGTLYEKFIIPLQEASFELPEIAFSSIQQIIINTRKNLRKIVNHTFSQQSWSLLLGMLIGDKSTMSKTDYKQFIESGLVHIIAVSGGNIAIVVIFLGAVLFWVPFYIRNALIILGIFAFAMICWGDSSVLRAVIMAGLALVALFWGRELSIWRLLRYAALGMLLFNPYFLIYDLGFLLSFWAVIGIALGVKLWEHYFNPENPPQQKKPPSFWSNLIKNYLLPTFWASLGTLPVLLFFIGTTNLTGVLINIVVVPLVPIVTIGGFITVLGVWATGWEFLTLPIEYLLKGIYWASDLSIKYRFSITIDDLWTKRILIFLLCWCFLCLYRELQNAKKEK